MQNSFFSWSWRGSVCAGMVLAACGVLHAQAPLGAFSAQSDVGTILHAGSASYNAAHQTYTVTGSGENIWANADAFHYVWKKVSGDVSLSADIAIETQGGNPHRKAVLMLRQSLDADAVYVDAALHGSGLTSLQFRDAKGGETHEIESDLSGPVRLRIEKRGDTVVLFLAPKAGQPLRFSGASIRVPLTGEFYVGIGVCAHDKDASVTAAFSHVAVTNLFPGVEGTQKVWSTLETVPVDSGDRHVTYAAEGRFEAPNWTHDGAGLVFNSDGRLERLPVTAEVHPLATGAPEPIDTGAQIHCSNDHAVSPDGQWIAFSDASQPDHQASIYVAPIGGGVPRRVTQKSPSFLHSWSPDGKTLAFTGERHENFDIYSIPVAGGNETRLTTLPGRDDGPEFSPDGQFIYFSSERGGQVQIWRMQPDGSNPEQALHDETNDWFPHLSPDGKLLAFLAYARDVEGRPPYQDVELRVMTLADGKVETVAQFYGGQGSMNGPSWSPDSQKLAFVSYALLADDDAGDR